MSLYTLKTLETGGRKEGRKEGSRRLDGRTYGAGRQRWGTGSKSHTDDEHEGDYMKMKLEHSDKQSLRQKGRLKSPWLAPSSKTLLYSVGKPPRHLVVDRRAIDT